MATVIDVGTNTVILLIAKRNASSWQAIKEEAVATRFGAGEGHHATLNAVAEFVSRAKKLGEDDIRIIGTAALRLDAGKKLAADIRSTTQILPDIISPESEAKLSLISAADSFGWPIISADIGGGSTDVAFGKNLDDIICRCFEGVGAVALFKKSVLSDPPTSDQIAAISKKLGRDFAGLERSGFKFAVSGGTATTLASIDLSLERYDANKVHGHKIPVKRIEEIFARLVSLPAKKRNAIAGLKADRADIIVTGTAILIELMKAMGIGEAIINHRGMRWGALIKVAATNAVTSG